MHSFASHSQRPFHSCSSERKTTPRSPIAPIMASNSKALLVLALLLAATFLVASANEQAREQAKEEKKAEVQDWHGGGGYPGRGGGWHGGGGGYPGGHCRWGCCDRGHYGGCRCCSHPDQIPEPMYRPELVEVHN